MRSFSTSSSAAPGVLYARSRARRCFSPLPWAAPRRLRAWPNHPMELLKGLTGSGTSRDISMRARTVAPAEKSELCPHDVIEPRQSDVYVLTSIRLDARARPRP